MAQHLYILPTGSACAPRGSIPTLSAQEERESLRIARFAAARVAILALFYLLPLSPNDCYPCLRSKDCEAGPPANKFGHIRRVNTSLGLFIPALVTPLELLGVDHESNA